MKLIRENILTLIGSSRYHSCILTTFSFDFYFFEMKAMKWLRACGVRNVNVLIDGHYYSELMKQATGEEMQQTPGYSLYPVFQSSIFHPKIWMLFGKNEGLLIIGSGNLTNSGNGANDEIWGAFHFDLTNSSNGAIFSSAWNYVSMLCASVEGQMKEKTTNWITENSKWVKELPKPNPFQLQLTSKDEKATLLYNSKTTSIWNELSRLLKNEKVIEITTISPFYDKNGKALQELKSVFPKVKINVIIDDSGLIPSDLPLDNSFSFYDWYEAGVSSEQFSKSDQIKSKLHAKIILFTTKNGKEFCLFGSANCSPEGLGLLSASKSNSEVSLLIESNKGGILKNLGIKLSPEKSKKLTEFNSINNTSIYQKIIKNNRFSIQLKTAELQYDELTIHNNGKFADPFKAVVFDSQNKPVHTQKLKELKPELKFNLDTSIHNYRFIQLFDKKGEAISNKILVSDFLLIAKTHPDPRNEVFEQIYNEIYFNGDLSRVLDLLHIAILDDSEGEVATTFLANSRNGIPSINKSNGSLKIDDLSNYKYQSHHISERNLLHSSPSLRVLELLKFLHYDKPSTSLPTEIRVDEQEQELGDINGVDESELDIFKDIVKCTLLQSEKYKLKKYFDDFYQEIHCFKLYPEDENECPFTKKEIPAIKDKYKDYKVTLNDISKYLISLELLMLYGGKFEKCVNADGLEIYFDYIPHSSETPYDNNCVKGYSLNVIGDFLMLVKNGIKEYEFDYTRKKLENLKQDALVNTILCVLNIKWKEDEMHYMYSIIFNALHYLGVKKPVEFAKIESELNLLIEKKATDLKYKVSSLQENLKVFQNKILPAFILVINKKEQKKFDTQAVKGDMLYSYVVGYSYVSEASVENEFSLVRPGFVWDNVKEEYNKFRPDKFYKSIKLPSFIRIDI